VGPAEAEVERLAAVGVFVQQIAQIRSWPMRGSDGQKHPNTFGTAGAWVLSGTVAYHRIIDFSAEKQKTNPSFSDDTASAALVRSSGPI
jgi:hypothetical protein